MSAVVPHRENAPVAEPPTAAALTIGIEEEVLLVTPNGLRLVAAAPDVLQRVDDVGLGTLASELCAESIELISPVCRTASEAGAAIARLRKRVRAAGATTIAAGVHPISPHSVRTLASTPRYMAIGDDLAGLAVTPTCAMHVHVGMPDPQTMIRVHNGLRAELPLLLALSANSPFWFGKDSGLASARMAILRSYPRTGIPRAFANFDDYCDAIAGLCAAAVVPDYTYVWWDVRPHPRLGTIEVRIMDAQTSLEASIGLATLVHGLVGWLLFSRAPLPEPPQEVIQESAARAMRYGTDASLADRTGRLRPVAALAREAVARAAAYAEDPRPLEAIEAIIRTGGGARRQREMFTRGGRSGLLRMLVRDTVVDARRPTPTRPRLGRFVVDRPGAA